MPIALTKALQELEVHQPKEMFMSLIINLVITIAHKYNIT